MGRMVTTTKEIQAAIKRSKSEGPHEITVREAVYRYASGLDVLVLQLSNGTRVLLPREQLQGLRDAPRAKVANIEILGGGTGLHWPDLNVDLWVEGLLNGIYGTKRWMSNLGRIGGSVRSKAKTEAARLNGLKGGRPKRTRRVS